MKCALCGKEKNVFHGIDGHPICNSCLHKVGDDNPLTISLRDHFAGQVLITLPLSIEVLGFQEKRDMYARAAYAMADAMLKARGE